MFENKIVLSLPRMLKFRYYTILLFSQVFFQVGNSQMLLSYDFATYLIDARTGHFLHGQNYKKKLHPASLTKMMTLYLTFNEIKNNRINLDDLVTISPNASREPPSKLGLLARQKVTVRSLVRGAAIRSANDAATALAEHISGSEAKFADYMTITAREMGMKNTNFRNAHGLTSPNHLSTPKDMAILARRLILDFPEYYNLFGRISVTTLGRKLYNTNRKFLGNYTGADGIKTGFTSSAGFNLAASAMRKNVRLIGIIFGGGSVALRNKRMQELLDIGFAKAPANSDVLSLKKLILSPEIINRAGLNSLLTVSQIPRSRPHNDFFKTGNIELIPSQLEKIVNEVQESFSVHDNTGAVTKFGSLLNLNQPPARPNDLTPNKLFNEKIKSDQNKTSSIKKNAAILVGFYYNKYNAEKDLPGILLSDTSLLQDVQTEISKETFMDKLGYRIRISPLSEISAQRACAKIRATGELCEVPK